MNENPLLEPNADPLGLPPFARLRPEHFRPAFDAEVAAQLTAIEAIAGRRKPTPLETRALELSEVGSSGWRAVRHLAGRYECVAAGRGGDSPLWPSSERST